MVAVVVTVPVAGAAASIAVVSTWRSTISAALRSGVPEVTDPSASEDSRNRPEVWNACLMSLPVRLWSRLVRCASTWVAACCTSAGRFPDAVATLRLANSGARDCLLRRRGLGRDRHRQRL